MPASFLVHLHRENFSREKLYVIYCFFGILYFMEPVKPVPRKLAYSFKYAFQGFHIAVKTETNWIIGIIESIIVVSVGIYLNISRLDWILVVTIIGIVLSAELCNSAIEVIVDSFVTKEHPNAKIAKDFAAGQSVIVILAAAVAGTIIFWPYIHFLR